jgi:hypothetical protein
VVNLRLGRQRALRNIERDLAGSDAGLDELFGSFTEQVRDELMPTTEKIKTRRLRLLAWLEHQTDHYLAIRIGIPSSGQAFRPGWPQA